MKFDKEEMKKTLRISEDEGNNPLKKMQTLEIISEKILTLIFTLTKKRLLQNSF